MRVFRGFLACMTGIMAIACAAPALSQQAVINGGVVANGKAIATTWCSACHLVGPAAGTARAASDLPTFASIAQRLPTDIDFLAAFIANPHPPMPNLGLSRQEVRDLLAYISTLR